MEKSRLPLFRRRSKSKSPGGSPSIQPLDPGPVPTHGSPGTTSSRTAQIKSRGPMSPQTKSPEVPVWAKRLKDGGDVSPLHSKVPSPVRKVPNAWASNRMETQILVPPPIGRNSKRKDVIIVGKVDDRSSKTLDISGESVKPPPPVPSVGGGETKSHSNIVTDSQTIDKDLLEKTNKNNRNAHMDLALDCAPPTTIVCPPRILKPPPRGQSVNSDSSTSPHHDYVELDYTGIYEECLPSPDYTELNILTSSASSTSAPATPAMPKDSSPKHHPSHQSGDADETYSKLGRDSQRCDNGASQACPEKMVSSTTSCGNGCPCCADINGALSEEETRGEDTDSEAGGGTERSHGRVPVSIPSTETNNRKAGLDRRQQLKAGERSGPVKATATTAQVGCLSVQSRCGGDKSTVADIYRSLGDCGGRQSNTCDVISSHTICNDAYQSSDQSPDTDYYGSGQLEAQISLLDSQRQERWASSCLADQDVSISRASVTRPKSDEYNIDVVAAGMRTALQTGNGVHSYNSWGGSRRDTATQLSRGLGYKDLTVNIPDSPVGSGRGSPFSPPFSAPPHNMSMNSIPEVSESLDYEHLPGQLLPGLLSPTQRGSFPRLSSSRRPSCGVRMVEIRAGIRQGLESPRGSVSDEFTSRESLRDSPRSSIIRDSAWESPRNSGIRESPRSSLSHVSSRGSVRESPDISDASRENSLRHPHDDPHHDQGAVILDLTTSRPPPDHTTSSLPQDYSCHPDTDNPVWVPHISRSISDDPRLIQNSPFGHQQQIPPDLRLQKPQSRRSWESNGAQVRHSARSKLPCRGDFERSASKSLSPSNIRSPSSSPRNLASADRGSPRVFQYGPEHLRAYGINPLPENSKLSTPTSGVSHSTNTTTSVFYTSSTAAATRTSQHWGNPRGQHVPLSSLPRSRPEIRSPTQLDSVYEHIYEEPANLLSPESCDESQMGSDYFSGSGTMTRSHSSMSYDALLSHNNNNTLTKSSSSPSQLKATELAAPRSQGYRSNNQGNSPTRSVQRLDTFGNKQVPEAPTRIKGQSIQHRKLPDPPQRQSKKDGNKSNVSSLVSAYEQSATSGQKVSQESTGASAKLKYAQVKPIKRSKSPKSSLLQSKLSMMFLRKGKDSAKSKDQTSNQVPSDSYQGQTETQITKSPLRQASSEVDPCLQGSPSPSSELLNSYQSGSSGFVSNQSMDKSGSSRYQCPTSSDNQCKKKMARSIRPTNITSDIAKEIKSKSGYYHVRTGSGDTMAEIDLNDTTLRTNCASPRNVVVGKVPGAYAQSGLNPQIQKSRKGAQGLVRARHSSGPTTVQEPGSGKGNVVPGPKRRPEPLSGVPKDNNLYAVSAHQKQSTPLGPENRAIPKKAIPSPKHVFKSGGIQPQKFKFPPSSGLNNTSTFTKKPDENKIPSDAKDISPVKTNKEVRENCNASQYADTGPKLNTAEIQHNAIVENALENHRARPTVASNTGIEPCSTSPNKSHKGLKVKVGVGTQTEPALLVRSKDPRPQRSCQGDGWLGTGSKGHVAGKSDRQTPSPVTPVGSQKGSGDKGAWHPQHAAHDYTCNNADKSHPTIPAALGTSSLGFDRVPRGQGIRPRQGSMDGNPRGVKKPQVLDSEIRDTSPPHPLFVKPYASSGRSHNFLSKFGFAGKTTSGQQRESPSNGDEVLHSEGASSMLPRQLGTRLSSQREETGTDSKEGDGLNADINVDAAGELEESVQATCNDEESEDILSCSGVRVRLSNDDGQSVLAARNEHLSRQTEEDINNDDCPVSPDEDDIYELQCYEHAIKGDYQRLDLNLVKRRVYRGEFLHWEIPHWEYQSLDSNRLSSNNRKVKHDYTRLRPNSWASSDSHYTRNIQPAAIQLEPQDIGSDSYQLLSEITYVGQGPETGDSQNEGFDYSLAGSMIEASSASESYQCLEVVDVPREKVDVPSQTSLDSTSRPESLTTSSQETEKGDNESITTLNETCDVLDVDETNSPTCESADGHSDKMEISHTPGENPVRSDGTPLQNITVATCDQPDGRRSDRQGSHQVSSRKPPSDSVGPAAITATQTREQIYGDAGTAVNHRERSSPCLPTRQNLFADDIEPDTGSTAESTVVAHSVTGGEHDTSMGENTALSQKQQGDHTDLWWDGDELSLDNKGEVGDLCDTCDIPEINIEDRNSYRDVSPKDSIPEVVGSITGGTFNEDEINRERESAPGDIICHYALQDPSAPPPLAKLEKQVSMTKTDPEAELTQIPEAWPSLPDMRPYMKNRIIIMDPLHHGSLDRRKASLTGRHREIMQHILSDDLGDSDCSDVGNSHEIWETFHSGLAQGLTASGGTDPGAFGNLRLSESGYDSWKSHDSGTTVGANSREATMTLNDHVIQEDIYLLQNPDDVDDEDRYSLVWRDKDSDDTVTVSTVSLETAGCLKDPDDSIDSDEIHADWLSQDTLFEDTSSPPAQKVDRKSPLTEISLDTNPEMNDIDAVSNNNIVGSFAISLDSSKDPRIPAIHDNLIDEDERDGSEARSLPGTSDSGLDTVEPGMSPLNGACIYRHSTNGHIRLPDKISADSDLDSLTPHHCSCEEERDEGHRRDSARIPCSPSPQGSNSNEIMFIADSKAGLNDPVTHSNKYPDKQCIDEEETVAIVLAHSPHASGEVVSCCGNGRSRTNEDQVMMGSVLDASDPECAREPDATGTEVESVVRSSVQNGKTLTSENAQQIIRCHWPAKDVGIHQEEDLPTVPDCNDCGASLTAAIQNNVPLQANNTSLLPPKVALKMNGPTLPNKAHSSSDISIANTADLDSARYPKNNGSRSADKTGKTAATSGTPDSLCNIVSQSVNGRFPGDVADCSDPRKGPRSAVKKEAMKTIVPAPCPTQPDADAPCHLEEGRPSNSNDAGRPWEEDGGRQGENHSDHTERRDRVLPSQGSDIGARGATLLGSMLSGAEQSSEQPPTLTTNGEALAGDPIEACPSDDTSSDVGRSLGKASVSNGRGNDLDKEPAGTMAPLSAESWGTKGTSVKSIEGDRLDGSLALDNHTRVHNPNERSTTVKHQGSEAPNVPCELPVTAVYLDRQPSGFHLREIGACLEDNQESNLSSGQDVSQTVTEAMKLSRPGQSQILPVLNINNMPLYCKPESPPTPRSNSSPEILSENSGSQTVDPSSTFLTGESGLKRTRALSQLNVESQGGSTDDEEGPKMHETAVSETSLHIGDGKLVEPLTVERATCAEDFDLDEEPVASGKVKTKYGRQAREIPCLHMDKKKDLMKSSIKIEAQPSASPSNGSTPNSASSKTFASPKSKISPPGYACIRPKAPKTNTTPESRESSPSAKPNSKLSRSIPSFSKAMSPDQTSQPPSPVRTRTPSGGHQRKLPPPRRPSTEIQRQYSEDCSSRNAALSPEACPSRQTPPTTHPTRGTPVNGGARRSKLSSARRSEVTRSMSALDAHVDLVLTADGPGRLRMPKKITPDKGTNKASGSKQPGVMTRSAESGGAMNVRAAALAHQNLAASMGNLKVTKEQNGKSIKSPKIQGHPGAKLQAPAGVGTRRDSPLRSPKVPSESPSRSVQGSPVKQQGSYNGRSPSVVAGNRRESPLQESPLRSPKVKVEIPSTHSQDVIKVQSPITRNSPKRDTPRSPSVLEQKESFCDKSPTVNGSPNVEKGGKFAEIKSPNPMGRFGLAGQSQHPNLESPVAQRCQQFDQPKLRNTSQDPKPSGIKLTQDNTTGIVLHATNSPPLMNAGVSPQRISPNGTMDSVVPTRTILENGPQSQVVECGTPVLRPGVRRPKKTASRSRLPSYKQVPEEQLHECCHLCTLAETKKFFQTQHVLPSGEYKEKHTHVVASTLTSAAIYTHQYCHLLVKYGTKFTTDT